MCNIYIGNKYILKANNKMNKLELRSGGELTKTHTLNLEPQRKLRHVHLYMAVL